MQEEKEIWEPIPNTNELYYISSIGRVLRKKRLTKGNSNQPTHALKEKFIKPTLSKSTRYYVFGISIDGKTFRFSVHRLLAKLFIPNPENKPQVNHINGIRSDNRLDNLEWCTASENAIHSYRILGNKVTPLRGESNGSSKLTNEDVLEIRKVHVMRKNTTELMKRYNVDRSLILNIVNRKIWKHI